MRFEVRHKASSALAFAGSAGPFNKVSLPSAGVLFVGETFVLQALSSTLLKGAACEFVARSVAQEPGIRVRAREPRGHRLPYPRSFGQLPHPR